MKARLIALAVPFFFLLIGLELAVARARKRAVYRAGDALGDVGCGILQQVLLVFLAGASIALYTWFYDHARVVTWSAGVSPWVMGAVALLGVDLLYYWWHRMSHEVNVLWAAHGVHHQSEDYNLAVALRQSILTSFTTQPFFVPLAVLGVPPLMFATVNAVSTLYQFWIHTELVGKLGWLEEWLNTPSHHRVHHAINPRYLDKNYGAILIVWDRLFGTFAREEEACVYGVVKPFRSFNPIWAQVQPLLALARSSAEAPRAADKLRIWLAAPGWAPAGVAPFPGLEDGTYLQRAKYDPAVPPGVLRYVLLQFVVVVGVTSALMFFQADARVEVLAVGVAFVLVSLATTAGLVEGRRWAKPLEAGRLVMAAAAVVVLAFGCRPDR